MLTPKLIFNGDEKMKKILIKNLNGTLRLPGDKSISHRAIIIGSLAKGITRIKNLLESEDVLRTIDIMRQLGIKIQKAADTYYVYGKGLLGLKEPDDILYAGNSGTTIRLISGILAAQPFYSVITGDTSLKSRPMKRIIEPLTKMGAKIFGRNNNQNPPITIVGTHKIKGITYKLKMASAQVKSSILLAGLYAKSKVTIIEPVESRDHTERMFEYLRIPIKKENNKIILYNKAKEFKARNIYVPGDISSASYFIVGALLKEGNKIKLEKVGINPTRMGLINVLKRMGANIKIVNQKIVNNERVGNIIVEYSKLHSVKIMPYEIPFLIDEIPILAVASLKAEGKMIIRGAKELRYKESDRIKAIVTNLKSLGVNVKEYEDGFEMKVKKAIKDNVLIQTFNDHRIAMAFIVATLLTKKGLKFDNIDSIRISYPGFISALKKLQAK